MIGLVSSRQEPQVVQEVPRSGAELVPTVIRNAGQKAVESYLCFFAKGRNASTKGVYRVAARHFFDWCQERRLGLFDTRPGHVQSFFDVAEWHSSTKAVYFGAVRHLFAHFEADRVIDRSPLVGLQAPKAEKRVYAPKALAELKQFLADLDGYREGSDSYRPGLVAMFPAFFCGEMNVRRIASVTGIPLEEVRIYAERLRKNGIWSEDGKIMVDFDGTEDDFAALATVNIVLIIGCAAGVFVRVPGDEAEEKPDGAEKDDGV